MRRSVARLVCAVCAVCAVAAAADRKPFGVGVLRRDGILIPFASFDGRQWRRSWTPPSPDVAIPINVTSVPSDWWGKTGPLEEWQAWIGSTPRTIRVTQPDALEVRCPMAAAPPRTTPLQVVLRTDYRADAPVPPPTALPYPKAGLAISPPQPIAPIAVLPIEGQPAREIAPALLEAFNKAERRLESRVGHPVSKRAREGRDPTIEAFYAFGDSPRYFYVEATRGYRELGDNGCSALAWGTGWFVRDAKGYRSLETVVDLLNCDRFHASYMLPLGAIAIGDHLYWLAQFSGWDHERYVVIDLTPKNAEAVVSAYGGGC